MITRLKALGSKERAVLAARYFKTGKGEYGEGDVFLGLSVPQVRTLAREWQRLTVEETLALLESKFHEARLLALICLVARYNRGDETQKESTYKAYLAHTKLINNWDLVDASAPYIVGGHLLARDKRRLDALLKSKNLWEKRIAIVATLFFIKEGRLDETFLFAQRMLTDTHDLIHKAVGWTLREAGKKDEARLVTFLESHAPRMPRTMLRYAIERLSPALRKKFMTMPRIKL